MTTHSPVAEAPRPATRTQALPAWLPQAPWPLHPELACRFGVEGALLLAVLQQLSPHWHAEIQQNLCWYSLNRTQLLAWTPFWDICDLERLLTGLREQGALLIASAPITQSGILTFAFKNLSPSPLTQPQPAIPAARPDQPAAAPRFIAPHWQPDRNTLAQLAQHGITEAFAREQLGEFITYWRSRQQSKDSWDSVFFRQVLRRWREHESEQAKQPHKPQASPMTADWRPSDDALDVLCRHAGINPGFVEDAIPEFVLYWREQGETSDNWNRRFRDHVHRQWARFHASLEHDNTPRPLPADWKPNGDLLDVLRLTNIDMAFAESLVPEFCLYWRESGQAHSSWNTKFLQFIKRRWALNPKPYETGARPVNTRQLSLEALVNDRSWAD